MSVTIKATLLWAQLERVNDMSGKYQVDLTDLSADAVAALEEIGVTARYKEDRGQYITCKSKHPIRATTTDGVSLEGVSVGNGSQGVAVLDSYEWTFKGKHGVSPTIKRLVVTELITYEEDEEGEEADIDLDEAL